MSQLKLDRPTWDQIGLYVAYMNYNEFDTPGLVLVKDLSTSSSTNDLNLKQETTQEANKVTVQTFVRPQCITEQLPHVLLSDSLAREV